MLHGVITQNVDGLHRAAGSRAVIDLHGRIADVVCLGCRRISPRDELQERLDRAQPGFVDAVGAGRGGGAGRRRRARRRSRASGSRRAPAAAGVLKPDVVFFGENVPRDRVARATRWSTRSPPAGALLVAGSSLTVMSGLRFVRHAHGSASRSSIVNRGATRGDDLADVLVDRGCSETLTALVDAAALTWTQDSDGHGSREADRRPRAARGGRPAAPGPRRRRPDADRVRRALRAVLGGPHPQRARRAHPRPARPAPAPPRCPRRRAAPPPAARRRHAPSGADRLAASSSSPASSRHRRRRARRLRQPRRAGRARPGPRSRWGCCSAVSRSSCPTTPASTPGA